MKVGILAVQGDFEAHAAMLERMGVPRVCAHARRSGRRGRNNLARRRKHDAMEIPCRGRPRQELREHAARGGAMFGTCAGAILLAKEVRNPAQPSLGLADITVVRNAYGRQLASEVRHEVTTLSPAPIEMVFIRAPIIEQGPNVEMLATSEGKPVLVRQDRILISTFHPELTTDTTVHEYFLRMAGQKSEKSGQSPKIAATRSPVPVEPR